MTPFTAFRLSLARPVLCLVGVSLMIAATGCRQNTTETEKTAEDVPAEEETVQAAPPILGGTTQLRLQVTPSPNPPIAGANLFEVWTTDPGKMLDPVPNTKVTLKMIPPKGSKNSPATETVTTGEGGKAEVRMHFPETGTWTLKASVVSPNNGKFNFTEEVPVRLPPGMTEEDLNPPVKLTIPNPQGNGGETPPAGN